MNNIFNGQINISRDLRENKKTIIGKYDLEDLIFIIVAVGISIFISYYIGFYLRIIDEYFAIIISLIPMIIILGLGFKEKAGMRYIDYIKLQLYSYKTKNRTNQNISHSIDSLNEYVFSVLKTREVYSYRNIIAFFLNNTYIKSIKIRIVNDMYIIYIKYNYDAKKFIKEYKKNKLINILEKNIGIKRLIKIVNNNINDIFNNDFKHRILNINDLNIDYMPKCIKNVLNEYEKNNLEIYNEVRSKVNEKFICMVHLYNPNEYEKIINKLLLKYEVIVYAEKKENKAFVNTFILSNYNDYINLNNECREYNVVINSLKYDQQLAKIIINEDVIINPFNSYRRYI